MKLIIDIDEDIAQGIIDGKSEMPRNIVRSFQATIADAIKNGTPLEDIADGIKSHKWGNNEGSKEIYNNAIDDVLTYIEEKLGE